MPLLLRCPTCRATTPASLSWAVGGRCPRCLEALDEPLDEPADREDERPSAPRFVRRT